MIKSMNGDRYLQVVAGSSLYFSVTDSGSGMMRYNPKTYNVEVYDGNYWQILSHHATVSLTPDATKVLEWGQRKMEQEQTLQSYATRFPAVAAALQHRDAAQATLESVMELVKD